MSKILILLLPLMVFIGYFFYDKKIEKNSLPLSNNSTGSSIEVVKEFSLKSLDNQVFTLHASHKKVIIDELTDKIVFLKIFGWQCQYCQKEIPELIELKNDFFDTFDVIALESQKHSEKENLEEIKKHKINYHIVSGNGYDDFYAYLKKEYKWQGIIPVTMIIGEKGEVLAFEEGSKSYTLTGLLKMALERREIAKQIAE